MLEAKLLRMHVMNKGECYNWILAQVAYYWTENGQVDLQTNRAVLCYGKTSC